MPIQSPLSATIFQTDVLAALQNTGITQTSPGGKARAFADIVGAEMGGLEARSYAALGQALLPFATGDNLDFLGELYGVPRIGGTTANASAALGQTRPLPAAHTYLSARGRGPVPSPQPSV